MLAVSCGTVPHRGWPYFLILHCMIFRGTINPKVVLEVILVYICPAVVVSARAAGILAHRCTLSNVGYDYLPSNDMPIHFALVPPTAWRVPMCSRADIQDDAYE